ncbi:hypothetical protein LPTSP4_03440 [Leptospira ryugenii]|uniref:MaoC-like domain-containing protein n=1 Tax=Leptospira ryugenii TaxID=1917863 RepID=A0A2P2DW30_9LEPT|nr:SDR family oxidoreductase [Leptospira ryugenii]GBF48844.1 hypothetical protein LPTSP4_03440 [Leptospira ryugenii]
MQKYQSIQVGDRAEIKHRVTQNDIEKFIDLTGDDNRLHHDPTFAEKTSFKKPVAHGMLGASFISTIIGTKLPGDGALWFSQTLEFLLPVRVGDELTIKAEVTKKIDKIQAIELLTEIYNQDKQKVTTGVAQVKVVDYITEIKAETELLKKEKIALVLGGTGGIGSEVCRLLSASGFKVAIHYHSGKDRAIKLQEKLKSNSTQTAIVECNLQDEAQTKNMFEQVKRKFGTITAVVNCATIKIPNIKIDSLEWSDLQKQIDINVKANFNIVQSVLPIMEENNYGKLVFLTTQYTESTPPLNLVPYVTAKYALNGFVKSIAVELAPRGICANLVSPGMTETDLIADIPEKVRLITAAKSPIQRLAKPQDVANAVLFLVSESSDYMTGETIRVNGGQVML